MRRSKLQKRLQAVANRRHDPIRIIHDRTNQSKAARERRRRARAELKILNDIMDVLEHEEDGGRSAKHFLQQATEIDVLSAEVADLGFKVGVDLQTQKTTAAEDTKKINARYDRAIARKRRWLTDKGIDIWKY